jgi:hypothetical protein
MEKHITLVAAFHIAFAALGIFSAVIVFVILTGSAILSGDPDAMAILSIVGTAIASFLLILSLPELIGAIGLLKRKGWARILTLIVAALQLLNIPFGTALGVYTLWALLHDESVQYFYQESAPETATPTGG